MIIIFKFKVTQRHCNKKWFILQKRQARCDKQDVTNTTKITKEQNITEVVHNRTSIRVLRKRLRWTQFWPRRALINRVKTMARERNENISSLIRCHCKMSQMWKGHRKPGEGKINTALFELVFVKQIWRIFTWRFDLDKSDMNEWYYAKKTNESRMSCLPLAHPPSSPPLPSLMESTLKFKMTFLLLLPLRPVLVFLILLLVFGRVRVPGEPFFIERDDHLRTLDVGLFRRHKVRFIWIFPLKRAKEKVI